MSEITARGYFQYRWAIPGFTFILVVLGVNLIPLIEFLKAGVSEGFGVLLAFLSLLTGSALGFLVTQPYWYCFNKRGISGLRGFENVHQILAKYHYDLDKDTEERGDAVLDFIIYLHKDDKFLDYAQRRWDMYHLLSSTCWTLEVSLIIAYFCRILLVLRAFLISRGAFSIDWYIVGTELSLVLYFSILLLFLLCVLRKMRQTFVTNYYPMFEALVTDVMEDKEKQRRVKRAFPNFFQSETA